MGRGLQRVDQVLEAVGVVAHAEDWLYGPTALTPDEEPPMFTPIPLATADTGDRLAAVGDGAA